MTDTFKRLKRTGRTLVLREVLVRLDLDEVLDLFNAADASGFLYGVIYRPHKRPVASRKRYRYLTPMRPTALATWAADCCPCDRDGNLDPGHLPSGYPVRAEDLGEPVGLVEEVFGDYGQD